MWYLSVIHFLCVSSNYISPTCLRHNKKQVPPAVVNFTAGPLWILRKKREKNIKGPTRSCSALPNKKPRGFPSISRVRLMTANVDEDDCNKCRWFTGSLDKGYHHTELMVYARQHAADISDSEAFRVNTERVR